MKQIISLISRSHQCWIFARFYHFMNLFNHEAAHNYQYFWAQFKFPFQIYQLKRFPPNDSNQFAKVNGGMYKWMTHCCLNHLSTVRRPLHHEWVFVLLVCSTIFKSSHEYSALVLFRYSVYRVCFSWSKRFAVADHPFFNL